MSFKLCGYSDLNYIGKKNRDTASELIEKNCSRARSNLFDLRITKSKECLNKISQHCADLKQALSTYHFKDLSGRQVDPIVVVYGLLDLSENIDSVQDMISESGVGVDASEMQEYTAYFADYASVLFDVLKEKRIIPLIDKAMTEKASSTVPAAVTSIVKEYISLEIDS